jgi:hypothetical protein
MNWDTWQSEHVEATPQRIAQGVAEKIEAYLNELPQHVLCKSIRDLKKEAKLTKDVIALDTFTRALDKTLEGTAWRRDGRSVVRVVASDGFTPAT